ncbi:MAG: hypothetical protein AAF363_05170 [Bacteroidota bacterium]
MAEIPESRKVNLTWYFLASLAGYIFLSYFTYRYETEIVLAIYLLLFINYYRFYKAANEANFELLFTFGLVFRIVLLTAIPNFSDDFYRFIWDGRLLNAGIDPFENLPSFYMQTETTPKGINESLFNKLNSPSYFTIYPPVNQFVFWLSTLIGQNSIFWSMVVMKLVLIGAEIGSLFILKKFKAISLLNEKSILLYALNPLVIIELSGNLHFESILIFFLLITIWYLQKNGLIQAAIAIGLGVLTKLIPLMLLPLFLRRLKLKKLILFYGIVSAIVVLLTIPFLTEGLISGMTASIGLYFQKFEFNAGIYYLLRSVGYSLTGYNQISVIGKVLAITTFLGILAYSLIYKKRDSNIAEAFMWVFVIYFSLATTVHPWYICTILAMSIFTRYKFPVVWSFLIFLTYTGYSESGYLENLWVVALEYVIVFGFLLMELINNSSTQKNHVVVK